MIRLFKNIPSGPDGPPAPEELEAIHVTTKVSGQPIYRYEISLNMSNGILKKTQCVMHKTIGEKKLTSLYVIYDVNEKSIIKVPLCSNCCLKINLDIKSQKTFEEVMKIQVKEYNL